ncbi:hypothetical protein [Nocardia gipuzkoensis]|uniref:hypothetical protein n=1 Tax=Nocardia gipuzkoensis TaxID=2749991 RepID=UPI00237D977E|nr:hypothetical protein [Nocardia gipuzkoensis]MDE1672658.1 hypothetical protein [Nocardia gipuzkoensis]
MTSPVVGENLPVGRYRAHFRVLDASATVLTTETQRFGTPRLATSWLLYTALTTSSLPHLLATRLQRLSGARTPLPAAHTYHAQVAEMSGNRREGEYLFDNSAPVAQVTAAIAAVKINEMLDQPHLAQFAAPVTARLANLDRHLLSAAYEPATDTTVPTSGFVQAETQLALDQYQQLSDAVLTATGQRQSELGAQLNDVEDRIAALLAHPLLAEHAQTISDRLDAIDADPSATHEPLFGWPYPAHLQRRARELTHTDAAATGAEAANAGLANALRLYQLTAVIAADTPIDMLELQKHRRAARETQQANLHARIAAHPHLDQDAKQSLTALIDRLTQDPHMPLPLELSTFSVRSTGIRQTAIPSVTFGVDGAIEGRGTDLAEGQFLLAAATETSTSRVSRYVDRVVARDSGLVRFVDGHDATLWLVPATARIAVTTWPADQVRAHLAGQTPPVEQQLTPPVDAFLATLAGEGFTVRARFDGRYPDQPPDALLDLLPEDQWLIQFQRPATTHDGFEDVAMTVTGRENGFAVHHLFATLYDRHGHDLDQRWLDLGPAAHCTTTPASLAQLIVTADLGADRWSSEDPLLAPTTTAAKPSSPAPTAPRPRVAPIKPPQKRRALPATPPKPAGRRPRL